MAPTIKSCKMLYTGDKYDECLKAVKKDHEAHTEKLSKLPKNLSFVEMKKILEKVKNYKSG